MSARAIELLDRRILAAIRFVDALGRQTRAPVSIVSPDGARLFQKRPGEWIISEAPGLAAYAAAFDAPPAAPPAGSIAVRLDCKPVDPAFSPRRFAIRLPRDPDPDSAASLFRPIDLVLLPSPVAAFSGLAATLRVNVARADDGRLIEGALVRLRPDGGRPQARALTDAGGEALLLAGAIPIASPGPGAVVAGDFGASLDAIVDPALARFHAPADVMEARRDAGRRRRDFIDPDDVEARLAGAATPLQAIRIAAGATRVAAIKWSPP